MCSIDLANVDSLSTFGLFMFGAGIVSLVTGTTYFRGLINRFDDPYRYWSNTIGLLIIGIVCMLGVRFC